MRSSPSGLRPPCPRPATVRRPARDRQPAAALPAAAAACSLAGRPPPRPRPLAVRRPARSRVPVAAAMPTAAKLAPPCHAPRPAVRRCRRRPPPPACWGDKSWLHVINAYHSTKYMVKRRVLLFREFVPSLIRLGTNSSKQKVLYFHMILQHFALLVTCLNPLSLVVEFRATARRPPRPGRLPTPGRRPPSSTCPVGHRPAVRGLCLLLTAAGPPPA